MVTPNYLKLVNGWEYLLSFPTGVPLLQLIPELDNHKNNGKDDVNKLKIIKDVINNLKVITAVGGDFEIGTGVNRNVTLIIRIDVDEIYGYIRGATEDITKANPKQCIKQAKHIEFGFHIGNPFVVFDSLLRESYLRQGFRHLYTKKCCICNFFLLISELCRLLWLRSALCH